MGVQLGDVLKGALSALAQTVETNSGFQLLREGVLKPSDPRAPLPNCYDKTVAKAVGNRCQPRQRGAARHVARMAKLADAADLKSVGPQGLWGFKSPSGHQGRWISRGRSSFGKWRNFCEIRGSESADPNEVLSAGLLASDLSNPFTASMSALACSRQPRIPQREIGGHWPTSRDLGRTVGV